VWRARNCGGSVRSYRWKMKWPRLFGQFSRFDKCLPGFRPPSGLPASFVLRSRLDRASCRQGSSAGGGDCKDRDTVRSRPLHLLWPAFGRIELAGGRGRTSEPSNAPLSCERQAGETVDAGRCECRAPGRSLRFELFPNSNCFAPDAVKASSGSRRRS